MSLKMAALDRFLSQARIEETRTDTIKDWNELYGWPVDQQGLLVSDEMDSLFP